MKKCLIMFFCHCFLLAGFSQAPVNDACSGAVVLTCGNTISGNNSTATTDVLPSASCVGDNNTNGFYRGVWYRFTPVFNGIYELSTCNNASWDTYLRVYTGSCAALSACVGFNDDNCGLQSGLSFTGVAGSTYFILLGGFGDVNDFGPFSLSLGCITCTIPTAVAVSDITLSGATVSWSGTGSSIVEYGPAGFTPGTGATAGGGTVIATNAFSQSISGLQQSTLYNVFVRKNCTSTGQGFSPNSVLTTFNTLAPPPANDECLQADTLTLTPKTGNTLGATQSMPVEICNGFTASTANDVWYTFTAQHYGNVTLTVDNPSASFDAVVQVYVGSCGIGNLLNIGCADSTGTGGTEKLTWYADYGQTYFVRVYGYSASGTFSVSLCSGYVDILPDRYGFCGNDTITIIGGLPNASYEWFRNGNQIPGEVTPILKTTVAADYYANAQSGGCQLVSAVLTLDPAVEPALIGGTGVYADDYFPVNIGITNYVDEQTYYWRKSGIQVYGPPYGGSGGNQSFQFPMDVAGRGVYVVEALRNGCPGANSNLVDVYYGGVDSLNLDSVNANRIGFHWKNFNNPVQKFQYAVSLFDDPSASTNLQVTTGNTAVVEGLLPGTTYYVHVRGASFPIISSPFSYFSDIWKTMSFTTPLVISNECANAQIIGLTPLNSSNVGATQSMPAANCSGFTSTDAPDVWFKFTAYAGGNATVKVTNNQGGFDAVLQLFSGSCGSLTDLGCIDATVSGEAEQLSLTVTEGQTYYARVYGWAGMTDTFEISVCVDSLRVTGTAAAFCSNVNSITLNVAGGGTNFSWYQDGGFIPGETSATYITSTPGTYTASWTDGNCLAASNEMVVLPAMVPPGLGGTGVYTEATTVNVGIPITELTQSYTWKKNSAFVFGPLSGNGSNQSFFFPMSPLRIGTYKVESTRPGCDTVYSNDVFVHYGGVTNLRLNSCPFNSVDFSWQIYDNPIQQFQYAVTTLASPPASGTVTSGNTASVGGLSPSTSYYLHVRGAEIPSFDSSFISYISDWTTLPFTTSATPMAANQSEWSGSLDNSWNEPLNWKCGLIPAANFNVIIPSGRPNYPLINSPLTLKTLTVQTGASISISPGIALTITN